MTDSTRRIDWSNCEETEDIDFTCPYCEGEGKMTLESWLEEELGYPTGEKDADGRGKYVWETNKTHYTREYDNLPDMEKEECGDVDAYLEAKRDEDDEGCQHCNSGYLEPLYNYAYPISVDLSTENKKKTLECGLFLFEKGEGEAYMSLMGCGMDLKPNIIKAYRTVAGYVPFEWALEWRQDYHANLSEEDHRLNAEACVNVIENNIRNAQEQLKAVKLYLKDPEYVKRKEKEKMEEFDNKLKKLGKLRDDGQMDNMEVGLLGMMAVNQANKQVTE